MANLAELVVALTADASKYSEGLNHAQSQLKDFQKSVNDAVGTIAETFAAAFTVDKIVEFTAETLEAAAALEHLSQETGASVESLSELQGAAKLSGIDDLSTSLARLSKAQGEVATGNEKVAGVFQALGISVQDVVNLKPDQLLLRVADSFAKYADGAQKSAAAQLIFGRNGQLLIPILDQGAAGILAREQRVDDLGGKTLPEFAKAAEEFESSLAQIKIQVDGIGQSLVQDLLPSLKEGSSALSDFLAGFKNTNDLAPAIEVLGGTLKALEDGLIAIGYVAASAFGGVKEVIQGANQEISGLADAAMALVKGGPAAAAKALQDSDAQLSAIREKFQADQLARDAAFLKVQGDLWGDAAQAQSAQAKKNFEDQAAQYLTFNAPQAQLELPNTEALKAIDDEITDLQKKAATLNLSDGLVKTTAAAVDADIAIGKLHDDFGAAGLSVVALVQKLSDLHNAAAAVDAAQAISDLKGQIAAANQEAAKLNIAGGLQATHVQALQAAEAFGTLHDKLALAGGAAAEFKAQLYAANLNEDQKQATASVAALTNEIQEQIDTFQKGKIDVDQYKLAHGVLGEELKETGDKADAARAKVLTLDIELQKKINANAIVDLNAQLDTLHGNLEAAALATFDLQHAQQLDAFKKAGDTAGVAQVAALRAAIDYQAQFNQELQKEQDINDQLAQQITAIQAAQTSGSKTDLQAMSEEDAARQTAIARLQAIQANLDSIAQKSGLPELDRQAAQAASGIVQLKSQTDQLAYTLQTDFVTDASSAFTDFIDGTKSAHDAFKSFMDSVFQQIDQLVAKNLFQSLFSTSGSNGIFSDIAGLFGGGGGGGGGGNDVLREVLPAGSLMGLASGGPVTAGTPYLVGESGPEVMVSGTPGQIIPNGQVNWGGGKSQKVTQNIFVKGQVTQRSARQLQLQASRQQRIAASRLG